ncbi:hypothetical protein HHK36_008729 [Tetracentron sinense]|uniref:Protein FAR1-RELATED SEQUENCE n=1 Tax=Tetracentron sinense TaxID=13715 RepID=A0A835DNM6_TETSI|nr:hypothetical protein HHK36_008729 [Tetracentron sinense]
MGGSTMNGGDEGCFEDEVGMNFHMMNFVTSEGDSNLEPYKRMEFESNKEAYTFYKEYARIMGFGIYTLHSRRSRLTGEFIAARFVCSRYGKKRQSLEAINPQPCERIDCKAELHVKRRGDGKWIINDFIMEHNHELLPAQSHYFRSHRSVTPSSKNNVDILHACDVPTNKIHAAMSKQCGGNQTIDCIEKGTGNQIDKERRLDIEVGDAQAMLEHFIHMHEENPNFFYAMDLNEEQCLRNVCWVDAKCKQDYINFGDVVCFDTSYLTNKYKMPFAHIIGVNHHFQPILLGCALIADETMLTFVWVMKTWLRAMGGVAPKAIVTNQSKAMKAAIAEVFPNASHRFYLWHVLSKIPEKLSHVTKKHENFVAEFNKCIYNSWTDEQFENQWWKMINTFELRDDEWIRSLYEDRKQWAPTYMRDTILAGMSTTQRSESVNSFFDKYVHKKTTLKEFLEQYKVILRDRNEEELKADFNTWLRIPSLRFHSPYEKQMSTMYTHEIFKKFQAEVLGIVGCYVKKEREDGTAITFGVQDFDAQQDFIVSWDETKSEVSCSCRLFEYKGFLCRHAMVVLQCSAVTEIPSLYILKRWSKEAKSRHIMRQASEEVQSKVQRYNDLCHRSLKLSEDGSSSQESYNIAVRALEEATKQCAIVNNPTKSAANPNTPVAHGLQSINIENQGRSTASTLKVQLEVQEQSNPIAPNPSCGGFYVTQQSMLGLGQSNAKQSIRNGYFARQHRMQRLSNSKASRHKGCPQQSKHGLVRIADRNRQLNLRAPPRNGHSDFQQNMQRLEDSNIGCGMASTLCKEKSSFRS